MKSLNKVTSVRTEKRLQIVYKGETDHVGSTKMASTAEAIFYVGESTQHPDLKLQQWGNAKGDVGKSPNNTGMATRQ